MATALLKRLRETRQMGAMRITPSEAAAVVALIEAAQRYRYFQGEIESAQGARAPIEQIVVALGYAALDLDNALSAFVSTQEAAA